MTIRVQRPEELKTLLPYVHDRRFSLDELRLDEQKRQVSVALRVLTDREVKRPWLRVFTQTKRLLVRAQLNINEATGITTRDEARVGSGDINTVSFSGRAVIIEGSLPVVVVVQVDKLDIELIISDEVVGEVPGWSIGYMSRF